MPGRCPGGEQHQAAALGAAPGLERGPGRQAGQRDAIEIVQPDPAQAALVPDEAARLDDHDRHRQACGQPQHGRDIDRVVRLKQSQLHVESQRLRHAQARPSSPCDLVSSPLRQPGRYPNVRAVFQMKQHESG